jgi:hypothetical protein
VGRRERDDGAFTATDARMNTPNESWTFTSAGGTYVPFVAGSYPASPCGLR